MIGKIKGTLVEITSNVGLIETASGVFYQVYLPASMSSEIFHPA
jgi:Holliday junction resolvasome RuvABC DNA-binding subunit